MKTIMKDIWKTAGARGLARVRWIFYKELAAFFGSNTAPLALGLTAFLCGLMSTALTIVPGATYEGVTRVIFHAFYILIMTASIFLSMSSFVNEKKQGTMELLYTLPVSDLELALGKFLMGAAFVISLTLFMTLIYIVGIAEAPWYMTVTGAFGLMLVGFYAYAVGLFASSLTENYLTALLIAAAIVLGVDIGGFLAGLLPSPARDIITHMHGLNQFLPFTRGRIPLRGTVFFAGLTVFFLFLTVRTLESRRWRGG